MKKTAICLLLSMVDAHKTNQKTAYYYGGASDQGSDVGINSYLSHRGSLPTHHSSMSHSFLSASSGPVDLFHSSGPPKLFHSMHHDLPVQAPVAIPQVQKTTTTTTTSTYHPPAPVPVAPAPVLVKEETVTTIHHASDVAKVAPISGPIIKQHAVEQPKITHTQITTVVHKPTPPPAPVHVVHAQAPAVVKTTTTTVVQHSAPTPAVVHPAPAVVHTVSVVQHHAAPTQKVTTIIHRESVSLAAPPAPPMGIRTGEFEIAGRHINIYHRKDAVDNVVAIVFLILVVALFIGAAIGIIMLLNIVKQLIWGESIGEKAMSQPNDLENRQVKAKRV